MWSGAGCGDRHSLCALRGFAPGAAAADSVARALVGELLGDVIAPLLRRVRACAPERAPWVREALALIEREVALPSEWMRDARFAPFVLLRAEVA